MAGERFDFRQASTLTAGARGRPGNRTFYLLISDGRQLVQVWVEKEQLQALSLAITQLLYALPERPADEEAEMLAQATVAEPGGAVAQEIKARRLALAFDRSNDRIGVLIYIGEAQTDDEADLAAWVSREQLKVFAARIDEVVAAGRPICPLCGGPIDPNGHICPKQNGHFTSS